MASVFVTFQNCAQAPLFRLGVASPTPQPEVASFMVVRACVVPAPGPLHLSPGLHEDGPRQTQTSSFCFHEDSWLETWRLSWLALCPCWFLFSLKISPQISQGPAGPRHHSLVSGHCLGISIPAPSTDPSETFWLLLPCLTQGFISPALESSVKLLDVVTAEAAL